MLHRLVTVINEIFIRDGAEIWVEDRSYVHMSCEGTTADNHSQVENHFNLPSVNMISRSCLLL